MGLFTPKAVRLLEKGSDCIYSRGEPEKGLQLIQAAAQAGNKTAVFFLAGLYAAGQVQGYDRSGHSAPLTVAPDPERALALCRQLPQVLRVKFCMAALYESGPAACRDEGLAWQLYSEVKRGEAEPDWAGLWLVDKFDLAGGEGAETLQRKAGMRAAVMQFWGRGARPDDAAVARALGEYESAQRRGRQKEKEYWDPDALFCLEALLLRRVGAETYYGGRFLGIALQRLIWAYTATADPEIRRMLEGEMLAPRLIPKLEEESQLDTPYGMRETLAAMQTVAHQSQDPACSIRFGDAGYECLRGAEKKFLTKKYYLDYFTSLEICSGGLGNLRATCLLAECYLTSRVTNYHGVTSSKGSQVTVTERDFNEQARRTLVRMENQIRLRREGRREGEAEGKGIGRAESFMRRYKEKAMKVAPEECRRIEALLQG